MVYQYKIKNANAVGSGIIITAAFKKDTDADAIEGLDENIVYAKSTSEKTILADLAVRAKGKIDTYDNDKIVAATLEKAKDWQTVKEEEPGVI